MEKYPLVKLTWADAHGSATGSYTIDEIPHAPVKVQSYGLLLKDDEVGVSLASEICDSDVFRGYGFYPRALIVKVEPIVKKRKRKLSLTPSGILDTPIVTKD